MLRTCPYGLLQMSSTVNNFGQFMRRELGSRNIRQECWQPVEMKNQ